jgi:DNA-binding GntR family transcriptional regulator
MLVNQSSPFGGQSRTRSLIALQLLGQSYPRELSRLLGGSLFGIQKAIASLEKDGLIAGRSAGRTRILQINPRYFAYQELRRFLQRLAEAETQLRERISKLRRRPRRTGKRI